MLGLSWFTNNVPLPTRFSSCASAVAGCAVFGGTARLCQRTRCCCQTVARCRRYGAVPGRIARSAGFAVCASGNQSSVEGTSATAGLGLAQIRDQHDPRTARFSEAGAGSPADVELDGFLSLLRV